MMVSFPFPKEAANVVKGDYANADPVTGQAAWFDLRVRITPSASHDARSHPQFASIPHGHVVDSPLRYGADFRRERDTREAS